MNMAQVLDHFNISNKALGDYINEDGLLYCSRCHAPKQAHGVGLMDGKLLFITCDCQKREQAAEEKRKLRDKAEELRKSCLPVKAMHRHNFEAADESRHIQIARRYVEQWNEMRKRNMGLMFWGNTGTGKRFAAHCVANAMIDQLVPARVYSAGYIVDLLQDRSKRDEIHEKINTLPLLILDDIGAERETPYAQEKLCSIIDERSEAGLPLIVTTNYTIADMDNYADAEMQRIFDRLRALCIPVAVIGESRRRVIGAHKLREAKELLNL